MRANGKTLLQVRALSITASTLEQAVDATIENLRAHPMLLGEVLKRADSDLKHAVLSTTAEEAFSAADADGDGNVSQEEQNVFLTRYRSLSPSPPSATATASVPPPTSQQLARLMLQTAVPFVGFGFLDNAIMITAGDQIDAVFGAALSLSSMAAAGLGNLVSDVIGIQASS